MRRGRVALAVVLAAALACRKDDEPTSAGEPRSALDQPIVAPRRGDPAKAAAALREATRALDLGNPHGAVEACEAALVADPSHLDALLMLGTLQLSATNAPAKALLAFRTALAVDPALVGARLGEMMARVALEDDARADALLRAIDAEDAAGRVTLSSEQRSIVRRSLATIALRARRFEDALRDVEGALALRGNDGTSVRLRAEVLERTDRLAEADADLVRAIAMQPESASAHFARARVLRRLGRAEEADREQRIHAALRPFEEIVSKSFYKDWPRRIELRRALIAAFPEFRRARHLLVRELYGGDQLDAALAELESLLAEQEKDAEAWFLLARVAAKRGDKPRARAAADRMLALDPRRKTVHADLVQEIERGPDAER